MRGDGVLRRILVEAAWAEGCSLDELTVLRRSADPYRLDTTSGHRDGAWVAEQLARLISADRSIHWRGLHYALVANGKVGKPNGTIYRNVDGDWEWLSAKAGKAAKWLGYVDFDRITDNRNDEPHVFRSNEPKAKAHTFVMTGSVHVALPDHVGMKPWAYLGGDIAGPQPFALAIFGEKSSLANVLLPIAQRYSADLYLGQGEPSDTHLHRMAKDAVEDGRRLIVFTCCDCDPAGYQMSTSIGRKFQALRDLRFPDLEFELHPVALTVEQVKELRLPSSPLKATEKRADKWRAAFGVEQTEIDALATLNPSALRRIVTEAMDPYFDATLARRELEARQAWQAAANALLAEKIDAKAVADLEDRVGSALADFKAELDDFNEEAEGLAEVKIRLPKVPKIEAELGDTAGPPLISTDMSWAEQTHVLIARKRFGEGP